MKKSTLLKMALTLVGAFMFTGAMAQNPPSPYARYDSNVTAPDTIDYVTFKTGGTTMGYYALPDPLYHPSYVASGTITTGFSWVWTNPTNPGTAVTFGSASNNYVQITYPSTGNYVINVAENASATFGGCADGTPTVMNVTVINPPTFTISAPALASTCGNQGQQTISAAIVENVPANWAAYAFLVTEEIDELDVNDNVIVDGAENNIHDFTLFNSLSPKLKTPALTGTSPNYAWSFTTANLNVNNSHRTRYVYRFKKASDAPAAGNGVISAITQKSDYIAPGIANLNAYGFTPGANVTMVGDVATITYIVNPAPSTGPIYHIPNQYAY